MDASPRIFPCPVPGFDGRTQDDIPEYYVTLPAQWLGEHTAVYDAAVERIKDRGYSNAVATFIVSLALTDDFMLPGLNGKLTGDNEGDKSNRMSLDVIAWVNEVVHASYMDCFNVKKKYFSYLSNLLREEAEIRTRMAEMTSAGS